MRRPRSAALALLLLVPAAAGAQEVVGDVFPHRAPPMLVCNAAREGIVACLAGTLCACRFERGGSIVGRPDGFRWDCGALRPSCGPAPADLAAPPMPMTIFPQITVPQPGGYPDLPLGFGR